MKIKHRIGLFIAAFPICVWAASSNLSALGGTSSAGGATTSGATWAQVQAKIEQESMTPLIATPSPAVSWDATTCSASNQYQCATPASFWASWLSTGTIPAAPVASSSSASSSSGSGSSDTSNSGYQVNY